MTKLTWWDRIKGMQAQWGRSGPQSCPISIYVTPREWPRLPRPQECAPCLQKGRTQLEVTSDEKLCLYLPVGRWESPRRGVEQPSRLWLSFSALDNGPACNYLLIPLAFPAHPAKKAIVTACDLLSTSVSTGRQFVHASLKLDSQQASFLDFTFA